MRKKIVIHFFSVCKKGENTVMIGFLRAIRNLYLIIYSIFFEANICLKLGIVRLKVNHVYLIVK